MSKKATKGAETTDATPGSSNNSAEPPDREVKSLPVREVRSPLKSHKSEYDDVSNDSYTLVLILGVSLFLVFSLQLLSLFSVLLIPINIWFAIVSSLHRNVYVYVADIYNE